MEAIFLADPVHPHLKVLKRRELLKRLRVGKCQVVRRQYLSRNLSFLKLLQRLQKRRDTAHRDKCHAHRKLIAVAQLIFQIDKNLPPRRRIIGNELRAEGKVRLYGGIRVAAQKTVL